MLVFSNMLASTIEKGIRIEYQYNFGLLLGNSAFVTICLEFDLLVRTIVQIQVVYAIMPIYNLLRPWFLY